MTGGGFPIGDLGADEECRLTQCVTLCCFYQWGYLYSWERQSGGQLLPHAEV